MRKIILSVLSLALVCIMISSCAGSCKSSGTAESAPESTPIATPTEVPETTEESTPEATQPETEQPETTETKAPETRPVITVHDHKFNEIWLNDENEHWHKCNFCAKTGSNAPHEMEKTAVFAEPTENTPGKYIYTCKTCHYSYIAEESN